MDVHASEALLRLLDLASAAADARGAASFTVADVRDAAFSLAVEAPPSVRWRRVRLDADLIRALSRAGAVALASGTDVLDVECALAALDVDHTVAAAAAGRLTRSLVEEPPSDSERRSLLISVRAR